MLKCFHLYSKFRDLEKKLVSLFFVAYLKKKVSAIFFNLTYEKQQQPKALLGLGKMQNYDLNKRSIEINFFLIHPGQDGLTRPKRAVAVSSFFGRELLKNNNPSTIT